jgi:hypothetical protein
VQFLEGFVEEPDVVGLVLDCFGVVPQFGERDSPRVERIQHLAIPDPIPTHLDLPIPRLHKLIQPGQQLAPAHTRPHTIQTQSN